MLKSQDAPVPAVEMSLALFSFGLILTGVRAELAGKFVLPVPAEIHMTVINDG